MSEIDSAKERLLERQQRLAKWKLKQAPQNPGEDAKLKKLAGHPQEILEPEPSKPEKGVLSESHLHKDSEGVQDERSLQRQRRLEEWKKKKQAQEEAASAAKSTQEDDKMRKKERLEAWKRKRALEASVPRIIIPRKNVARAPAVRRRVIDLEAAEDEHVQPKFKVPKIVLLSKAANEPRPEVDELDAFISSLENSDMAPPQQDGNNGFVVSGDSEFEGSDHNADSDNGDSGDAGSDNGDPAFNAGSDSVIQAKLEKLQQEKELSHVDHSAIEYASFRKEFYTEPDEISSLSPEQIAAARSLEGIRVKGTDVPAPVSKWAHLSLSPIILDVMKDILLFEKPTPIQAQALPALMSGRDFLGIAQTGSGKTLAFLLPLLTHVLDQPPLQKGDGPIAILLSPTRELAQQIYKQLTHFTKKLGLTSCCCYGGSPIEAQIAELKKGSQIVVATPGRLIDLLAANNGKICNLQRVTYAVLDEADRMFDFGFEPQVNKIFSQIRPDCQKIFFSATFARKLEALVRNHLTEAVEVVVGGISIVAPEITQHVELFEVNEDTDSEVEARKLERLLSIIESYPKAKKLIFVEKQLAADGLLVQLLSHKMPATTIHGGKEQLDRRYAIRDFSSPDSGMDILIATSIAARGLDVKGLDLVINYDPPSHMEDYVHRVGRTGRAGRKGDAFTFVKSTQERSITDTVKALRLSKVGTIDERLVKISEKYAEKLKKGTEKMSFGFGGRGLSKLDQVRSTNQTLERKAYNEPEKQKHVPGGSGAPDAKSSTPEIGLDLPEFKVIAGKAEETSGPDKGRFYSRVTINDLPQKARWTVVNRDTLSRIIETTLTSITNKGQYYPPKTKVPQTIKSGGKEIAAPPKLYLLIEGLTEQAVNDANRMIRDKMIEGLEQTSQDENSSVQGKYTV